MCSFTVQLLKSTDLGRHSLLYLKEIGHGWFGKVSWADPQSAINTGRMGRKRQYREKAKGKGSEISKLKE